jgi:hypothetical protein
MKSLEQEAEEYAKTLVGIDVHAKKDFIAGANSKWVQAEKIKAQIEIYESILNSHNFSLNSDAVFDIKDSIKQLKRKLINLKRKPH